MSDKTEISMRRITEVSDAERPGFQVRFYTPKIDRAWFSVNELGRDKALSRAQRWRDSRERELGLSKNDYGRRRPRKAYADSAFAGVFVSVGFRNGKFYADVIGSVNYTDDEGRHRRKQRGFSILTNGYHEAYVKAVEARCKLARISLPGEVEVPKLGSERIETIRKETKVTKVSLTRTALVPWTGKQTISK